MAYHLPALTENIHDGLLYPGWLKTTICRLPAHCLLFLLFVRFAEGLQRIDLEEACSCDHEAVAVIRINHRTHTQQTVSEGRVKDKFSLTSAGYGVVP